MSTSKEPQATGERDVIRPMDNHQPIAAPGVTPRVKKRADRDVVKPLDNHQPIAGTTSSTTGDNHQPLGEPK
ncbi:hypothetical protein [Streptomyces chattanoogensis]|uniref:Uncharacterized protein n=1 Tax=Streptomyces chattanoogensis TaxID=66876 RepID=A0A0N0XW97_9ACTN|nr:hypothetical protein [Streptomyces chattanoogensis]KPC62273.1 hypothetical protein ADL29_21200 [Streptomyces chattanoogensis]